MCRTSEEVCKVQLDMCDLKEMRLDQTGAGAETMYKTGII